MVYSVDIYSQFLGVSIILILAAFAIPISRKISVVDLPVLIVLGFLFGPILGIINHQFAIGLLSNDFAVGVGILGIVIILYSESHTINFRIISREAIRIVTLDTLGLMITALGAAAIFTLITGAPLYIGFLFGAIISPTDPASLVPVFRKVRVQEEISGILVGESLFNDPLGILLVSLGIAIVVPYAAYVSFFSTLTSFAGVIIGPALYMLIQISVPAALGIAVGFVVIYLNRIFNFDNLLVGFLLGMVILEFTLMDGAGLTPFPAIIATGAIVGNYSDKSIFWEREANFQQSLAVLARAIIFILLGGILTLNEMFTYLVPGLVLAGAVMLLARPAGVFTSLGLVSKIPSRFKIDRKTMAFMGLVGPRGAVSIVMSLVPYTIGLEYQNAQLIHWGQMIYVTVSYVVILSIILQTVYAPWLARKLLKPIQI